uniref:Uncharacterized protein n=1 Tax=viral metagenome TaxID=1070528 RepID=A0A6C0BKY9_9ZZZZ
MSGIDPGGLAGITIELLESIAARGGHEDLERFIISCDRYMADDVLIGIACSRVGISLIVDPELSSQEAYVQKIIPIITTFLPQNRGILSELMMLSFDDWVREYAIELGLPQSDEIYSDRLSVIAAELRRNN